MAPHLHSGRKRAALALGDEIVVYVRDTVGNVAHGNVRLVPEPDAAAVACGALAFLARRRARRNPG